MQVNKINNNNPNFGMKLVLSPAMADWAKQGAISAKDARRLQKAKVAVKDIAPVNGKLVLHSSGPFSFCIAHVFKLKGLISDFGEYFENLSQIEKAAKNLSERIKLARSCK